MGWDSNPRMACAIAGFQDRCLKPLGHPSVSIISTTYTLSAAPNEILDLSVADLTWTANGPISNRRVQAFADGPGRLTGGRAPDPAALQWAPTPFPASPSLRLTRSLLADAPCMENARRNTYMHVRIYANGAVKVMPQCRCGNEFSEARAELGLDCCLECGGKEAAVEIARRAQMIVPISHKSGYTYLGSDRATQHQRLIEGSAKTPRMETEARPIGRAVRPRQPVRRRYELIGWEFKPDKLGVRQKRAILRPLPD
jgi:hypothetical protein